MTQIIWKQPDGQIAITTLHEATDADAEAIRLVENGLVPSEWTIDHVRDDDRHYTIDDMRFFSALTATGSDIKIDMAKARDIWRDHIREARAPKLAALDVEWQRADETGDADAKANIASHKQVLRDLTDDPAIAKAKNVDALKAFWPDALT